MTGTDTADRKQRRRRRSSLAVAVLLPVATLGAAAVAALAGTSALSARDAARAQLAARADAVRDAVSLRRSSRALERGVVRDGATVRVIAVAAEPRSVTVGDRGPSRVYTYPAGQLGVSPAVLEVSVPSAGVGRAAARAALRQVEVGAAALALLLVALYWRLRRTLSNPLRRLVAAVERIRGGAYNARVKVEGAGPVRALAEGLDQIAAVLADLDAQAATDPLTGVANRRFFHAALATELARAERERTSLALVLLDLDGFKSINDTHGHPFGDGILQTIAGRLRATLRATDVLARVGGDEFALLLPGMEGDRALAVVERARAEAGGSVGTVELTWCAGVASYPSDADDADTLLECADAALYCAKSAGSPCASVYHPDDVSGSRRAGDRATIEALLALPDAVVPVFQPLISLSTGRVAGYEALARFPHPPARRPDEWFAIAHRCGLGPALEAYAARAALTAPARPAGTYLTFNLSPQSLSSDEVLEVLPGDLSGIVIEITEASDDPDLLHAQLAPLRSRGARIAIDDTGSGYVGLQHVMRMEPDIVKLDRALVANVDGDAAKAALVDSLVRFARRTGASICAEGVETPEELRVLASLGVAYGQGFGLARPAPPWASVSAWVPGAVARADHRPAGDDRPRLEQLGSSIVRHLDELPAAAALIAAELGADELAVLHRAAGAAALEALTDHSWMRAGTQLALGRFGLMRALLSTGEPAQVAGAGGGAVAELALLGQSGHGSMLLAPAVAQGEVVGVVVWLSAVERLWTDAETARARALAGQLSPLLETLPSADLDLV